jgi:hypothetical protein
MLNFDGLVLAPRLEKGYHQIREAIKFATLGAKQQAKNAQSWPPSFFGPKLTPSVNHGLKLVVASGHTQLIVLQYHYCTHTRKKNTAPELSLPPKLMIF